MNERNVGLFFQKHSIKVDKTISVPSGYSLLRRRGPRARLLSASRCLLSNRRIFDASVGFVFRRIFGLCAALRINSTSQSVASSRFRPRARNRRASIISMPPWIILLLANEMRRFQTSSGKERELATSKAKIHSGSDFIDVLPAQSWSANKVFLDLFFVNRDSASNVNHTPSLYSHH